MPNGVRHDGYRPVPVYRMTESEFRQFVAENDPLASITSTADTLVKLVHDYPWQSNDLGYGSVRYDAGENFYWVRTSRAVDWM